MLLFLLLRLYCSVGFHVSLVPPGEQVLIVQDLDAISHSFLAADYFRKRSLEIIVLAGARGFDGCSTKPQDLDFIADQWPMGRGTKVGLRMVWPGLRSDKALREALRVLQRALGG